MNSTWGLIAFIAIGTWILLQRCFHNSKIARLSAEQRPCHADEGRDAPAGWTPSAPPARPLYRDLEEYQDRDIVLHRGVHIPNDVTDLEIRERTIRMHRRGNR